MIATRKLKITKLRKLLPKIKIEYLKASKQQKSNYTIRENVNTGSRLLNWIKRKLCFFFFLCIYAMIFRYLNYPKSFGRKNPPEKPLKCLPEKTIQVPTRENHSSAHLEKPFSCYREYVYLMLDWCLHSWEANLLLSKPNDLFFLARI